MDMVDDLSGSHLDDDVRRAILVIVDPEGWPDVAVRSLPSAGYTSMRRRAGPAGLSERS
jgi:hypothetical protein